MKAGWRRFMNSPVDEAWMEWGKITFSPILPVRLDKACGNIRLREQVEPLPRCPLRQRCTSHFKPLIHVFGTRCDRCEARVI
jgi:hypothetical protein